MLFRADDTDILFFCFSRAKTEIETETEVDEEDEGIMLKAEVRTPPSSD